MNLRVLKDLSPVAVVTGVVANIRSKVTMDGYVPNSNVMHNASITVSGAFRQAVFASMTSSAVALFPQFK
jgi:hypothetical protein